jgi:hypothetical protein
MTPVIFDIHKEIDENETAHGATEAKSNHFPVTISATLGE